MEKYLNPICVNGHDVNVFGAGRGDKTIIFLAGAAVTAPALEYKPLWKTLTDTFRIAVVEKAGYGYSQGNTGASRDVKTMVDESREALARAGVLPPYCLAAHSYSGLEAIFWALQYPSEVECILGLDMVTPSFALVQNAEIPAEKKAAMMKRQSRFLRPAQKSEFLQKMYAKMFFGKADLWKSECLDAVERAEYCRLFFRNICNSELIDEQAKSTENAQQVQNADLRSIPAILFISDMDCKLKKTTWKAENTAYAEKMGWEVRSAKSHQLYVEQAQEIADAWKVFLEKC
ncbi:MAG: alpha/beta hydrolase [Ruminococcus sp.]|nr:alpha/beta hydrolase [Ruminococcus sp.]